jgi:hypothetical protein
MPYLNVNPAAQVALPRRDFAWRIKRFGEPLPHAGVQA